jgi:hypothetical protein
MSSGFTTISIYKYMHMRLQNWATVTAHARLASRDYEPFPLRHLSTPPIAPQSALACGGALAELKLKQQPTRAGRRASWCVAFEQNSSQGGTGWYRVPVPVQGALTWYIQWDNLDQHKGGARCGALSGYGRSAGGAFPAASRKTLQIAPSDNRSWALGPTRRGYLRVGPLAHYCSCLPSLVGICCAKNKMPAFLCWMQDVCTFGLVSWLANQLAPAPVQFSVIL